MHVVFCVKIIIYQLITDKIYNKPNWLLRYRGKLLRYKFIILHDFYPFIFSSQVDTFHPGILYNKLKYVTAT